MHSIENNYSPSSFENIWLKNNQRDLDRDLDRDLRNANEYVLPQPRTETFKKSTLYALPSVWNNLIPELKFQQNRITFKWALKAHLMENLVD